MNSYREGCLETLTIDFGGVGMAVGDRIHLYKAQALRSVSARPPCAAAMLRMSATAQSADTLDRDLAHLALECRPWICCLSLVTVVRYGVPGWAHRRCGRVRQPLSPATVHKPDPDQHRPLQRDSTALYLPQAYIYMQYIHAAVYRTSLPR